MKRSLWLTGFVFIAAFIIIVVIGGLLYINSGSYNIAATEPHTGLTLDIIEMTMDASVHNHAEGIVVPELTDSLAGFPHYDEMCVDCHGAPGIGRSEFGQGLYPRGPGMVRGASDWNDAELFWIIKHGIKMTGMPAFEPTHSDEAIWSIVAFVRKLTTMTDAEYAALRDSLGGSEEMHEEHEHQH